MSKIFCGQTSSSKCLHNSPMGQVFNRGDVLSEKTPLKSSFPECASYFTFSTHLHEKKKKKKCENIGRGSPQSNSHVLSYHVRKEPQLSPASDSSTTPKPLSTSTTIITAVAAAASSYANRDHEMSSKNGYCDNYIDNTDGYENSGDSFGFSFSKLKT